MPVEHMGTAFMKVIECMRSRSLRESKGKKHLRCKQLKYKLPEFTRKEYLKKVSKDDKVRLQRFVQGYADWDDLKELMDAWLQTLENAGDKEIDPEFKTLGSRDLEPMEDDPNWKDMPIEYMGSVFKIIIKAMRKKAGLQN